MVRDVRVTAGSRIHFGFQNLSLAHERLYGGIGVALETPRVVVRARPSDAVRAPDEFEEVVKAVTEHLGVEGVELAVESSIPPHVGLGSGTQHALAASVAIGRAHGRTVDPRRLAPILGRGGRSGVGVAAFEDGGFVLDGGHPSGRFTSTRPADGEWTVPPAVARHDVPGDWRFLLVRPEVPPGQSGANEDRSIRSVVERADPGIADRIAGVVTRRLLPSVARDDPATFGEAVAEISRLNGAWYADEQGGVFRPPLGEVVETLEGRPHLFGVAQSSWGPTTVGVTTVDGVDEARAAGRDALEDAGVEGTVRVVSARNEGATVEATDAA